MVVGSGVVMCSGGGQGGGSYQTNMKTNQQSYHSCYSSVMEKVFPLTLKTEQGANLQRQQTGRGPCRCGLGSSCCVNHVQISTQAKGTRHLCHRVQSREEMKGLNLFLSGQRIIWPWRPGGPVLDTGSTWYNRVTALLHPLLNVGIISTTTVRSRIPV